MRVSYSSLVFLFLLCACFTHIHQGTLAVDAIRYAHISRLILESGDWFRLYDAYDEVMYSNKPPFLMWCLALLFKLFGFSTFIAKFPSALFAFLAGLVLWALSKNRYGEKAGICSVLLLVISPFFGKDLVDLNFESIAFLGVLLCLKSLADWDRSRSNLSAWLFGLGLLLLLQSKPPYILLVLLPVGVWFIFVVKEVPWKFFLNALPLTFLGALWFIVAGDSYVDAAIANQIEDPLTISKGYFRNSYLWLKGILNTFPLISILGIYGIYKLIRSWSSITSFERLLVLWFIPALLILLLVDSRPRYLMVPFTPLFLIGGVVVDRSFNWLSFRYLKFFMLSASLVCILLFSVLGLKIHRANDFVSAMRSDPLLLDSTVPLCMDDKKEHRNWAQAKSTRLLLNLEFGKSFEVLHSQEIIENNITAEYLVSKSCYNSLKSKGLKTEILNEYPKSVSKIRVLF